MFIPKSMKLENKEVIKSFINEYGFAQLISPSLEAVHVPLTLLDDESEFGSLYGHVAKQNKIWKNLEGKRVLTIFNGPHAYISPIWYQSNPAVPTWNYATVHCYGTCSLLSDSELKQSMDDLIMQYEPELLENKKQMPDDYVEKLQKAVVGFKITITEVQAKEKLGQQKSSEQQKNIYQALLQSKNVDAHQLAKYMEKRKLGIGDTR